MNVGKIERKFGLAKKKISQKFCKVHEKLNKLWELNIFCFSCDLSHFFQTLINKTKVQFLWQWVKVQ